MAHGAAQTRTTEGNNATHWANGTLGRRRRVKRADIPADVRACGPTVSAEPTFTPSGAMPTAMPTMCQLSRVDTADGLGHISGHLFIAVRARSSRARFRITPRDSMSPRARSASSSMSTKARDLDHSRVFRRACFILRQFLVADSPPPFLPHSLLHAATSSPNFPPDAQPPPRARLPFPNTIPFFHILLPFNRCITQQAVPASVNGPGRHRRRRISLPAQSRVAAREPMENPTP